MLDPTSTKGETGTAVLRASCPQGDLYKSFSIILSDRRYVDLLLRLEVASTVQLPVNGTADPVILVVLSCSVDFTCHSVEQMTFLLNGFKLLSKKTRAA